MFNTKTLLAAASLAVLAAVAAPAANAAPWQDVRHDRMELRHDRQDLRGDRRELRRDMRVEHRGTVDRMRIETGLRFHRYRMIGDPYFVHGRYVVRVHDRFGRIVFVQVDPYSGNFIREVVL